MQGPLHSFVIYKILYFYAYTQVPDGVYTLRIPIYHENVHRNNKVGLLVINIIYNIGTQHLITIFSEYRMYGKYCRSRIRTGFNSVTCSVFLYIPCIFVHTHLVVAVCLLHLLVLRVALPSFPTLLKSTTKNQLVDGISYPEFGKCWLLSSTYQVSLLFEFPSPFHLIYIQISNLFFM